MEDEPDDIRRRVEQLPEGERVLLEHLAALGWFTGRTRLCKQLTAAGVRRRGGQQFSARDLLPLLEALVAGGLVETQDYGGSYRFRSTPQAGHWALARVAGERRLVALMQPLLVTERRHHYGWVEPEDLLREVRLRYYAGQLEAADAALGRARPYRGYLERYEQDSLACLFGATAPAEALAVLSPAGTARYLTDAFGRALELLSPVGAAAFGLLRRQPAALRRKLLADAALLAALQGDAAACRALASPPLTAAGQDAAGEGGASALSAADAHVLEAVLPEVVEALASLVEGDLEGARRAAARAVEASRGPRRTRKPKIERRVGKLIALLLLTDDEPEPRLLGSQLLAVAPSKRGDGGALREIEAFLTEGREARDLDNLWLYTERRAGSWLEQLFWTLLGVWAARPAAKPRQPRRREDDPVEGLVGLARRGGYGWLADQLVAARAAQGAPSEAPPGSLVQLYRPRPDWERALDALIAIGAGVVASGAAGSQAKDPCQERLVWRVRLVERDDQPRDELDHELDDGLGFDEDHGYDAGRKWRAVPLTIEPRRQKRRGQGWTRGRRVSLATLRKALDNGELTEEDRRLCAHITPDGYYGRRMVFDEAAPLSLVGHPRVFWDDDDRAADVARAEPTLQIERSAGQLRVRLRPAAAWHEARICCERAGDRLLVYALDDRQRALGRAIGAGLALPVEAEPRLKQTLGALAGVAAVESAVAVAGAAAERVAADPRPVVQLFRARPGLRVRLVVCPLGLEGPVLVPGLGPKTIVAKVAERRWQAERDADAERELAAALLERCPTLAVLESGAGEEARLAELEGCYELLAELAHLGDDEVVVAWPEGEPLGVVAERGAGDLRLRLSSGAEWFEAQGSLPVDEQQVLELQELLEAFDKAHGRFIELEGGRLLALSEGLRRRLDQLAALSRRRRGKLELHPLAALTLEGWAAELAALDADSECGARLARVREAQALAPVLPSTLRAELRDYQREGYRWLARLAHWGGGGCLADDMGLGKTVQVLALMLARAEVGPALVVAPTSVCATWLEQAARFAPTLQAQRYGPGDRAAMRAGLGAYDLLVCSYGLMVNDAAALAKVRFGTVVLDEAQAIKNAATRRAKAAMSLQTDQRLVTTGTPLENHLGELWSVINFCNPGLLGSARQFEQRYARPIQRDGDRAAARRLRRLLRPFILRRTKSQVLEELPPKTEITLRVEPTPGQLALYEGLRRAALERAQGAASNPQERMRLLAELMKLRRVACHPRLVLGDEATDEQGAELGGAKLEAFEGLVAELRGGGHKALVFSQFVDHLTLARERLDAAGVSYQYLDGSTPTKARDRAVAAFQRGEGDLFLISLRAGGFGLNLTAADYVIHLDPWWNPAVEDQASDRAHRIGQRRPVTIYRLVTEGTIEERVLALHSDKRELAARMLEGSEQVQTLGVDQLRALLQDD